MYFETERVLIIQTGQLSLKEPSARFQLEHMGHLLKREERTDPDSRVDNFIPDTWQVCKKFSLRIIHTYRFGLSKVRREVRLGHTRRLKAIYFKPSLVNQVLLAT